MSKRSSRSFVAAQPHACLSTGEVIRMLRELKGWAKKPSPTSPATSVIIGPKPAEYTGGGPNGWGPGSNAGIMMVWL